MDKDGKFKLREDLNRLEGRLAGRRLDAADHRDVPRAPVPDVVVEALLNPSLRGRNELNDLVFCIDCGEGDA